MPPEQQSQNPYGQNPTPTSSGPQPVMPAIPAPGNNGHTGHNPYEFIMNHPGQNKKGFHLPALGGGSLVARLVVVIGGALVLIVIAVVLVSLLSPASSSEGLTKIAQRQTEIARIAELASDDVSSQETRNFVANVSTSVGSEKQQVISYLSNHKIALEPAVLALNKNSQTDTTLESAKASGTYDAAVADALANEITTYALLLKSTYKSSTNDQTKQLLSQCYLSAVTLLKQAEALKAPAN